MKKRLYMKNALIYFTNRIWHFSNPFAMVSPRSNFPPEHYRDIDKLYKVFQITTTIRLLSGISAMNDFIAKSFTV